MKYNKIQKNVTKILIFICFISLSLNPCYLLSSTNGAGIMPISHSKVRSDSGFPAIEKAANYS
jgi:hypothetical protein